MNSINSSSDNSRRAPKRPPLDMFRAENEDKRRAIVEKYLGRLIGGVHSESMQLMFLCLEANGCILGEGAFMLAIVVPDGFSPADSSIISTDELYERLGLSVHTMLDTHCINYYCEITGIIAAVMCFPHARDISEVEDGEILQSFCEEQFSELLKKYELEHNLKLRVYISGLFFGSEKIPEIYSGLIQAWRYDINFLKALRDRPVMTIRSPRELQNDNFDMIAKLSENVSGQIRSRGAASSQLYMESLRQMVLAQPYTWGHLQIRLQLMIGSLSDRLDSRNILVSAEKRELLARLCEAESWEELQRVWKDGMALFLNPTGQDGIVGTVDIKEITEYIKDNISCPWLSISAVAERFEMSQVLLSQRFKRCFGYGPLEYMRRTRVELAVSLLEHTDFTIYEVSVSAGYGSLVTMQRDFKKFAGCSPSTIRQKALKKEQNSGAIEAAGQQIS